MTKIKRSPFVPGSITADRARGGDREALDDIMKDTARAHAAGVLPLEPYIQVLCERVAQIVQNGMDPRVAFPRPLAPQSGELMYRNFFLAVEVEGRVRNGAKVGEAIRGLAKEREVGEETLRAARRRYRLRAIHWLDEQWPDIQNKMDEEWPEIEKILKDEFG